MYVYTYIFFFLRGEGNIRHRRIIYAEILGATCEFSTQTNIYARSIGYYICAHYILKLDDYTP